MYHDSFFNTPNPGDPPKRPDLAEAQRTVADALVEVRRDNLVAASEEQKVNEDAFIIGALTLFMGETHRPQGPAMQGSAASVRALARAYESQEKKK